MPVLVLVSFGLVLLATILLVVGLLSDDGINLIYLSIGASATAAIVLFLAFRMARPKGAATTGGPAPLAEDIAPTDVVDAPPAEQVAPAAPPAAPTTPAPAPVATAADDDWTDDADWETDDGVVDFPIADYDDLTVAEIMPLLPQLYSDELDIVYEREQSGKNRSTILNELDKLSQTGTAADALDEGVDVPAAPAASPPAAPAARTPAPAPAGSLLGDDDFDDDAAFFPIADYDDLSASQIVPLLPQLELDELRDVRAREVAGANRSAVVGEIDRYLSGELEAHRWEEDAGVAGGPTVVDPEAERLPIDEYPQLVVSEVLVQLDGLSPDQLEQVLAYETARDNRFGIVAEIKERLDAAAPSTPVAAEAPPRKRAAGRKRSTKRAAPRKKATTRKKAAAAKSTAKKRSASKKATAKKATAKKSSTRSKKSSTRSKKSATKKSAARKSATRKSTAKRATKSTKKAAASRFPIDNYDELGVAAIRPLLTGLSERELRQVRDREMAGAGRKTILDDVERRLS